MAHPIQILLVEDNPCDRDLALNCLREHRMTNPVHFCADGDQALKVLAGRHHIGLVLLALRLPGKSGMEILSAIRAGARTSHLPVIVLTRSHSELDFQRCRDLGVDGYMIKPVDFSRVIGVAGTLGFRWAPLLAETRPICRHAEAGDGYPPQPWM
jgi:CheY-like chemotaxis protein